MSTFFFFLPFYLLEATGVCARAENWNLLPGSERILGPCWNASHLGRLQMCCTRAVESGSNKGDRTKDKRFITEHYGYLKIRP